MNNNSSEVYKGLRIAEIVVGGYRKGNLDDYEAELMYVSRSVNSWPFGVLAAEKDIVADKHVFIRCQEDPEWCGCLAEFGMKPPIGVVVNGKSRMAKIQVGQFVDVVTTDGDAKLITILNYVPEKFGPF